MNVSKHARNKYVERIKGITDTLERNTYISQNTEMIDEHINKMFNRAEEVYRGSLGGSRTTTSYYLFKDSKRYVAFVVEREKQLIITMYEIIYDFPGDISKQIADGLVIAIKGLEIQIEEEKEKVQNESVDINTKIDNITSDIKILENQLKFKREEKEILEKQRKNLNNTCILYNQQRDKYAMNLFGNTEYKEDVKICSI